MHLKIYLLLKFLFLCFIGRSNILSQANQDADVTNDQSSSYFFYQQPEYPRDCKELLAQQCPSQNTSQVHLIKPDGYLEPFLVYCEDEWTIILRRVDGFVNFHRNWTEYDRGFGFLNVDFWLGNEKLAYMTNQKQYELIINFETKTGDSFFVTYNMFRISDKFSNYTLVSAGDFTGTLESFVTWCPTNMVYGTCRCQATCADPEHTNNCNCSDDQICFCPDHFLMDGDDCIPQENCGCYLQDVGVIPEDETYVNSNCSQRCDCQAGSLTCVPYQCHTDATCKDEGGVRQCSCNEGYRGDGQTCTRPPMDCYDLQLAGNTRNGDYTINPDGWSDEPFTINCNMTIDGGGWTVFQRRINGDRPFNLGWDNYKEGFGTLTGEFWMGNDKLAFLTNQRDYELRIDFINTNSNPYYAKYDLFRIANEGSKYRIVGLGFYSGNAGHDSLRYHHLQPFSTIDRDNDAAAGNCASVYQSAWWYNACAHSDLNRPYTGSGTNDWRGLPGGANNIKYTEMKIRPVEGSRTGSV